MATDTQDTPAALPLDQRLQARLADPKTIDALERLLDRLDLIAFSVEAMDGFFRRGDTITDSLRDSIDELHGKPRDDTTNDLLTQLPKLAKAGNTAVELADQTNARAIVASGVLRRLTEPETLATIQAMLERLDLIAFLVEALDGFLRRGDTITDSLADSVGELRNAASALSDLPLNTLVDGLPKVVDAGLQMIDSGMLDPDVVRTLGEIGCVVARAHAEATATPPPAVGPWGMLRELRDPHIQRSMAVLFHIARRFGEHLSQ